MHDGIQANPSRGDLLNDPATRYKCWPEYDSHFTPEGWAYCECAILSFMGQNIALPKIKNECQMDWDKVFPKKKI